MNPPQNGFGSGDEGCLFERGLHQKSVRLNWVPFSCNAYVSITLSLEFKDELECLRGQTPNHCDIECAGKRSLEAHARWDSLSCCILDSTQEVLNQEMIQPFFTVDDLAN